MKEKYLWLLGFLLVILSFSLDNYFVLDRISGLNSIIADFSWFTNGWFSLIVVGFFVFFWKFDLIFKYFIGFGFIAGVVYGLKELIQRARPLDTILDASGFSFPSGHAAFAFFALGFIWNDFKKFKWVWLIVSILIVLARFYVGAHYLSDIAFGMFIGFVFGNLFRRVKIGNLF